MVSCHKTTQCRSVGNDTQPFFTAGGDNERYYRLIDEQKERVDDLLYSLVKDDDDDDDWLDLSPEGIEREARRWYIHDELNAHLFVLWSNMSGMGGESLRNLWELAQEPGSAALFRDFATLSARRKRLEQRRDFIKGKKGK